MIYVAGSFRLGECGSSAFLQSKVDSKMQEELLVTRKHSYLVTWPGVHRGIKEGWKCPWLVGDLREERLTHS